MKIWLITIVFMGLAQSHAEQIPVSGIPEINSLLYLARETQFSQPDSSYNIASKALKESEKVGDRKSSGLCQQFLGELLFFQGIYSEAGERFLLAGEIFQRLNNRDLLVENYNFQGRLHYKTSSPEEALIMHQKAYDLAFQDGNILGQATSMGWIGGMYEKMGAYSEALTCQWSAKALFEENQLDSLSAEINENLGSIYEDLEAFDSALYYFDAAYQLNLASGDSLKLINTINNLGDIYRKKGQMKKALATSSQALELSRMLREPYQLSSAMRDVAKAHHESGDFQKAYAYLDSSRIEYQEIYNRESARQLALMKELFEVRIKDQEINELTRKQNWNNQLKVLLVLLILAIVAFSLVVFSRQKLKSKAAEESMIQQKAVLDTRQKLIETELANVQLKERQMKMDLEANAKALAAETLHVIDKNRVLEELRKRLSSTLEDDPKEQKKKIRNLIKMIDFNLVHETDWNVFRNNFEKIHEDFFVNLNHVSNNLSPADLKLATLMKLNLGSKDIASTLGISQDSLRISRYRLRKKLDLKNGESLHQFIVGL
ncbi:tetratricopeptide repeat protein [Lunatibacter salilacus]|uniref:tetratricopeptide repeat protein n=1 Tax=Lunatibacter salilacus TaxID=2483804 RepID=UPI00131C0727|nr:tetratricopeptide repeat protein [Lunatibacter salilacus]